MLRFVTRVAALSPMFLTAIAPAGGYSLTVDVTSAFPGDPIEVCWTASPAATFDWVGLYRVGAAEDSYLGYYYTNGEPSGCRTFNAPYYSGPHEFRYFPNNLYVRTATSQPVEVLCEQDGNCADTNPCTADKCLDDSCVNRAFAPSDINLSASPNPVPVKGVLQLCWTMPANTDSPNDWISVSTPGSDDGAFLSWAYTNGLSEGCVDVAAPNAVGDYEIRFHVQGTGCVADREGPVSVCDPVVDDECTCYRDADCDDENFCSTDTCVGGGCVQDHPPYEQYSLRVCPPQASPGFPLTACWTSPPDHSGSDWVALSYAGSAPQNFIGWTYVDSRPNDCMAASAQIESTVEFRYLLDNGYCVVASSPTVQVCADCNPAAQVNLDAFGDCLRGPGAAILKTCGHFDFDCNDRVDLRDAALFQRFYEPSPE